MIFPKNIIIIFFDWDEESTTALLPFKGQCVRCCILQFTSRIFCKFLRIMPVLSMVFFVKSPFNLFELKKTLLFINPENRNTQLFKNGVQRKHGEVTWFYNYIWAITSAKCTINHLPTVQICRMLSPSTEEYNSKIVLKLINFKFCINSNIYDTK